MVNLIPEKSEENKTGEENGGKQNELVWESLPSDILSLIFSCLSFGDTAIFHTVCKTWESISIITPPVLPALPSPGDRDHSGFPWLVYMPGGDTVRFNFFHPIHNGTCHVDIPPDMSNAKIRFAKYGWLLMTREDELGFQHPFLYNPLTREQIHLPFSSNLQVMSFTSHPLSSDCLIVGFTFSDPNGYICIHKLGQEEWMWKYHDFAYLLVPFFSTNCNTIYHNGLYYSLSPKGNLQVFDPQNVGESRIVYRKPFEMRFPNSIQQTFLVENEGEMLAVLVENHLKAFHVLKWDHTEKTFRSVESLGSNMLFISYATSFSEKAVLRGTGNKIYFPFFFHNNGTYAFYSLQTKKFHSFSSDFSPKSSKIMKELRNCAWFKPNMPCDTRAQSDNEL